MRADDVKDMDRRSPDRPTSAYVACRTCGTRLPLQPGQMRLTSTHAVLCCAACGAQVRVRRSDGERDADVSVAKAVATAAGRLPVERVDEWTSVPLLLWGTRLASTCSSTG
jgi:transcription elongation factor Elf1